MTDSRIFVLCNSDSLAIPSIKKLKEKGILSGVGIVRKAEKLLKPRLEALKMDVPLVVLDKEDWENRLKVELEATKSHMVWALTFPWKIPGSLLKFSAGGFINFHFGLLPKYKGADPIFWQFRNLESDGGVTVHLMNEHIDEGPVLLQERLPIMPGENYGFHCLRLGGFTAELVEKIVRILASDTHEYLQLEQPDQIIEKKPGEQDLQIDWKEMTAHQVEQLVNATNPVYGGARTSMNDTEIHVLEVTPVTFDEPAEAEPGQIVFADSIYGVIVACADKECVRLTIVNTGEGYLSGVKLFNLGFTPGHKFG